MGTSRVILHYDLDAFFAAVEVLLDPSLAGKPLIIGARPGSRGVVATASYEARVFGVHSAMPIGHAYRLCPQAMFLPPRHGVYSEHSRCVRDVVARFSDLVQPVSIDEAFVDLSDSEYPEATARELKNAIHRGTGLVASIGLASSKLVSKIASDESKPDGFLVVPCGNEASFLAPLPVRKLWGVGPKTAERLVSLGIHTIGDLAAAQRPVLIEVFGARWAEGLVLRARGEDESAVHTDREVKSISDEHTFQKDERNPRALWRVMGDQCRHCAERLVRHDLVARTVTVKLRFSDFQTITRSQTLFAPTCDAAVLRRAVVSLMRQNWAVERRPLRLVGVRVSGLSSSTLPRQLPLL